MSSSVSSTSTTKSTYSYLQTANGRYTGLASGIDTESIMEKIMKAQSAQKEKLQQQYQTYEWKRDSYRDFYTKLSDLRDNLYDNYYLTSSWNLKSASSTNTSVATATASASANGTLNISQITSLAANSANVGKMTDTSITGSNTLSDIGVSADGYVTLSVLQSDGTMKDTKFTYNTTDTIDSFVKKINSSNAGVSAIFSNGSLSLSTNATGATSDGSAAVKVTDSSLGTETGIFENFGFDSSNTVVSSETGALVASGTNAMFTVNGLEMEQQSNTFTLNGYTVTLSETLNSGSGTDNGSTVSITSSMDVDSFVDKVKSFVSSYNDLISLMNTAVSEKKNLDYAPLTDAEKAEMTESEISAWNEKAKAGILKNDTYLSGISSSMRTTMYSKVGDSNDTFNYLFQIGVTTSSNYKDGGKLEVDETKLRAAIEKDPNSVINLFTNTDTGVVKQVRETLKSGMDSIKRVAGTTDSVENTYSLGTQMISLKSKIDDWTDRLKDIENRYWNQFTAMETAISKANSVTSMFS